MCLSLPHNEYLYVEWLPKAHAVRQTFVAASFYPSSTFLIHTNKLQASYIHLTCCISSVLQLLSTPFSCVCPFHYPHLSPVSVHSIFHIFSPVSTLLTIHSSPVSVHSTIHTLLLSDSVHSTIHTFLLCQHYLTVLTK